MSLSRVGLVSMLLSGAAVGLGVAGAMAQQAPMTLGPAASSPPMQPVQNRVAVADPAPAAAKPVDPTKKKPPVVAKKPGAAPVAGAAPAGAAKPKVAKATNPAAKVPPEARRAIQIANMTAQATPPVHDHVSIPVKAECPGNPDAIGVSRVIKVDTTGGFYVGQTYMTRMPTLQPKEVILTFDDGPMAGRSDRVLAALDHECTKATFFIVGQMAKAYPETLRKEAAAGHTIGYHTMTHPLELRKWPFEKASGNIRDGWQTVDQILYGAAGDKPATPFFRYPGLFNSRPVNEWFNQMGVGVFAIDAAGNDWLKGHLTMADGPNVMNEALKELEARQGGILLLHDIKDSSSSIVAPLLRELKKRDFKIVHIMPKNPPPALVAGPIKGVMPTIAETTLPVKDRNVGTYGTAQQLAQEQAGRSGKNSVAPLPAYQPAPVKASPLQSANLATEMAPTSLAAAGTDTATDTTATHSIAAAPAPRDDGWFASTASAFRGMGNAIGLW